jgi:2-polyprenyl-6-hydroxyphenyl methylase/3-demethylubiquinone-9 3-methyltransferase
VSAFAAARRQSTIDEAEVAKFAAAADEWWDPRGVARWLHRYNPVRVGYIRDMAARHFGRDGGDPASLAGLRLLDIGSGAGLLCEPLARLGATVVGADPARDSIETARLHARQSGLEIEYRCETAESLADAGERFDVVIALEVVEHVADASLFLQECARLVAPGGLAVVSTINRTWKSFAQAIVAAEYVFRMLPRGAHRWDRFLTPNEIQMELERNGLEVVDVSGIKMNLLSWTLALSGNPDVNFIMTARRPRGPGPELATSGERVER